MIVNELTIVIGLLCIVDLAAKVGLLALLLLHEVADLNRMPAHLLSHLLRNLRSERAWWTHHENAAHCRSTNKELVYCYRNHYSVLFQEKTRVDQRR